ncbi:MAG: AmmeMemoRadiSam system protein A [Candidatus Marinimicrobia bacterium]|nr:AmmeMemoRadiSam system protein A [Candidatus Neomarinimicrobiota bacterium]
MKIDQKKELLTAVRAYLEHKLHGEKHPELSKDPLYKKELGLFVTLHEEGDLRGCIGYIQGFKPLSKALFEMADAAAFHDPRFLPLLESELDDVEIEISILSELKEVPKYRDIIIGSHGILLKQGMRQAVFLPQVAPEQGWNLETTLKHLCRKAGLAPKAYKDVNTKFEVFTAEVFSEEEDTKGRIYEGAKEKCTRVEK